MLRSGEMLCADPSTWLRKVTPSSVSFLRSARLITWKPPESVRIGRCQFMKRWSPPIRATRSAPGLSIRW